jgi:hypothetical protein
MGLSFGLIGTAHALHGCHWLAVHHRAFMARWIERRPDTGRHRLGKRVCNGIANEPRGTARHMSPHISVGGDMTCVDPTLLRGREVCHLHPTIFARDDAEFGVLSNHADSSR